MARPLPKMKAPAFAKNQKSWRSRSGVATTRHAAFARRRNAGGAFATRATTPQRTKSETSSDSVHPVTTAITEKTSHWSRSLDSDSRESCQAATVKSAKAAAPDRWKAARIQARPRQRTERQHD